MIVLLLINGIRYRSTYVLLGAYSLIMCAMVHHTKRINTPQTTIGMADPLERIEIIFCASAINKIIFFYF